MTTLAARPLKIHYTGAVSWVNKHRNREYSPAGRPSCKTGEKAKATLERGNTTIIRVDVTCDKCNLILQREIQSW